VNANGTVTIPANTPAGNYPVTYTICEVTNPLNCSTITSTVVVSAPAILAIDDTVTIQSGQNGAIGIINALTNDTFGGSSANISLINISVITPATPISGSIVPVLNTITGLVNIPAGTPAGTYIIEYRICDKLNPSNCSTAIITIIIAPVDDIAIYNHITPNDDGDNEFFFIDGIQNFPDNTVEIYNRWGVLVYKANGYDNKSVSFKGTSNGRVTVQVDENLPEGTYYYIIRYVNKKGETKEKAAYLYINR
uniref:gliding motility-associated C-terminal domain-containing protein n=2 Tax=Flavobacterium sp. TaxID=239 RepID=UPI00286D3280